MLALLAAALLCRPSVAVAQTGQTATLGGTVAGAGGAAMPGATVTVKSESLMGGARSAITDQHGGYRFHSLPPGIYQVTTELAPFKTTVQQVHLQLGQTITLAARLEASPLPETINLGRGPVIDVTSTHLPTELLENIPVSSRFGPGAMLLAPGVNPANYSSYGSGGSSSNAYTIDGAGVSDPEGGAIGVLADHNWLQEVQVIGLGAGADYGGFTGVVSNSLFRSGSNRVHGLFETLFENDALTGSNRSDDVLAQNPDLRSGTTDYLTNNSAQIGAPLKQDKRWFFAGLHYYQAKQVPAGYPPASPARIPRADKGPQASLESSTRMLFKPTLRVRNDDRFTAFVLAETSTTGGRGAGAHTAPEATLREKSTRVAWNGNYTRMLSSSTMLDLKYSGLRGSRDLVPYNGQAPGWYDVAEDFNGVNAPYFYNADRTRHQANAAVTKFASGFAGAHDLKFGAEFERGHVKSEYGYSGGMYINSSFGVPYYAYLWDGYIKDNTNSRYSAYAHDSWSPGPRITINPGVRFDRITGFNKHLDDQVFATSSVSPRVGFAWDVRGHGRTVVRAHYGWYYDGAKSSYYDLLDPQISPVYGVYIDRNLKFVTEASVIHPGTNHTLDPNIKQPRLKQSVVGFEHELFGGLVVGLNAIDRRNDQFIDDILQYKPADFITVTVRDAGPDGLPNTGDETGSTTVGYNQLTRPATNQFVITTPPDAFRRYQGLQVTATKRLTGRWQLQGSWVISKITGNYDNTSSFGNSTEYDTPNTDPRQQPYREGRLTNDNTQIAKILGTYRGPWGALISGAFYYTTGATFTRTQRTRFSQGRVDLFIEPRGSQRYDPEMRADIRIEKQVPFAPGHRLGLALDGFNLLNDATITSRTTRSGPRYFTPLTVVEPRRFRVGAVYRF